MSPNPAPEVPAPHPPAPEGPSGPVRRRSSLRWIVVATVLVAALLAGLAAKKLWFDGRSTGTPTACGLASRAEDTEKLAPGTEAAQATAPHDGWRRYSDPSGFRIDHPTGWRRFGGGVCFGNRREGRYIAVDQWLQGDADLVAYWVRKEDQVKAAGLDGYERIAIKPRPNYFDGAADWEFTFDDGGEKMHVWAIALLAPGNRGYGYLWATPHSAWGNNLPDFSILTGAFRPAR